MAAVETPLSPNNGRPSLGGTIRRRLSTAAAVVSTGTGKDAVLEATRQRYEDKKRRISIVSPKLVRPPNEKETLPKENPISATENRAFDLLSPDDATEHYRQCLRLAVENVNLSIASKCFGVILFFPEN